MNTIKNNENKNIVSEEEHLYYEYFTLKHGNITVRISCSKDEKEIKIKLYLGDESLSEEEIENVEKSIENKIGKNFQLNYKMGGTLDRTQPESSIMVVASNLDIKVAEIKRIARSIGKKIIKQIEERNILKNEFRQ